MSKKATGFHRSDPRGFELVAEIAEKLERLLALAYDAPMGADPDSPEVKAWAEAISDEMRHLHALTRETLLMNGEITIQVGLGLPEKQA